MQAGMFTRPPLPRGLAEARALEAEFHLLGKAGGWGFTAIDNVERASRLITDISTAPVSQVAFLNYMKEAESNCDKAISLLHKFLATLEAE